MTTDTGKSKRSADFFISNPFSGSFQQENVLTHSQSPEDSYTPFVCSTNGQVESHCDSSMNCKPQLVTRKEIEAWILERAGVLFDSASEPGILKIAGASDV